MILEGLVKNLDKSSNYFLYLRFLQWFLNQQLSQQKVHKRTVDAPLLTKKLFANMRRVGNDFSGKETPLFPNMVELDQPQNQGEG